VKRKLYGVGVEQLYRGKDKRPADRRKREKWGGGIPGTSSMLVSASVEEASKIRTCGATTEDILDKGIATLDEGTAAPGGIRCLGGGSYGLCGGGQSAHGKQGRGTLDERNWLKRKASEKNEVGAQFENIPSMGQNGDWATAKRKAIARLREQRKGGKWGGWEAV